MIKCKECGKPLEINQINKGLKICYVCSKLSRGRKAMYVNNRDVYGNIITRRSIDLLEVQKMNKKKYGGGV